MPAVGTDISYCEKMMSAHATDVFFGKVMSSKPTGVIFYKELCHPDQPGFYPNRL